MTKTTQKAGLSFCSVRVFQCGLLAVILLLSGCTRQFDTIPQEPLSADLAATRSGAPENDSFDDAVPIVLGQDLKNPYDIAVMQQVLNALMGASRATTFGIGGDGGGNNPGDGDGGGDGGPAEDLDAPEGEGGYTTPPPTLRATHYYYRFLPATEEELDLLKERWELYSYPLTYEIASGGDYYHDPSLPESGFTWQYAVVPVSEPTPPTIRKELLSELFLNTDGQWEEMVRAATRSRSATRSDNIPDYGEVEEMAYNMLDIEEDPCYGGRRSGTGGTTTSKLFFPSGKIEMYDDLLHRNIPLAGVKVRIRNRFRTEVVFTLADGTFRSPKEFYGPVDYCIVWEHQRWDIRTGFLGQAYFVGPTQTTEPWNLLIKKPSYYSAAPQTKEQKIMNKASGYAAVHRGLMRYYYGDILGMVRPPIVRKMKIGYKHKSGYSSYLGNYLPSFSVGMFSDIMIYGIFQNSNVQKKVGQIFSDTCRKIAHWTYIYKMAFGTGTPEDFLGFSWTVAVDHFLTIDEYCKVHGMSIEDAPSQLLLQREWPDSLVLSHRGDYEYRQKYTPIFIDLVDTENQKEWNKNAPDDQVSGYTMAQLNIILFQTPPFVNSRNFKRQLLLYPKPEGATNENIELLFNKYFEICGY